MMLGTTSHLAARAVALAALAAALSSCSSEKKEPDCVPAVDSDTQPKQKIVSKRLFIDDQADKKGNDWCRACVMGNKGYASCQRVYGDTPTEARDAIKERARVKACVDSGYTATSCPASATIAIVCKGDPPPPNGGNPAAALQNLYRSLNPDGPVGPKQPARDKPSPTATDASGKPKAIIVE
jgi:hypothetical protein